MDTHAPLEIQELRLQIEVVESRIRMEIDAIEIALIECLFQPVERLFSLSEPRVAFGDFIGVADVPVQVFEPSLPEASNASRLVSFAETVCGEAVQRDARQAV